MTNPGGSRPIPFLHTSCSLKIKVPDESFSSEHHAPPSSRSFSRPLPRPFYTVNHLPSIFCISKTISSPPLYPPSEHPHRFPYGSWLAQRGSSHLDPLSKFCCLGVLRSVWKQKTHSLAYCFRQAEPNVRQVFPAYRNHTGCGNYSTGET